MLGYIISKNNYLDDNIQYNIHNFDVLCKTNLNIFIVEYTTFKNFKVCYKSFYGEINFLNILMVASLINNIVVLKWLKKSGYNLKKVKKYVKTMRYYISQIMNYEILKFWGSNIDVKEIIKFSKCVEKKIIKYKTKNNYIKGYNKN